MNMEVSSGAIIGVAVFLVVFLLTMKAAKSLVKFVLICGVIWFVYVMLSGAM